MNCESIDSLSPPLQSLKMERPPVQAHSSFIHTASGGKKNSPQTNIVDVPVEKLDPKNKRQQKNPHQGIS